MRKIKQTIIITMVIMLGFLFGVPKSIASEPAKIMIEGKTTVKQGEVVTYKMIVTEGSAVRFDGESYFVGETGTEDIFSFISFESDLGATYDSKTGGLYLEDEEGYAVSVSKNDVIGVFTFKIKEDAKVGSVKWLEGSSLEKTLTIVSGSDNLDNPVDQVNNPGSTTDPDNNVTEPTDGTDLAENENTDATEDQAEEKDMTGILIGIMIGMIVIIVGLVIALVTLKKRSMAQ